MKDTKTLQRIRHLAIPPAYNTVWICPFANGHIQATGRDEKRRKQYIYHPMWQEVRQHKKFATMLAFGKALPIIRNHIQQEMEKPITLEKSQIIAAILFLLDKACVRIGTSIYAKENKSYGLTTLRKKHLSIDKNQAVLEFMGKNAQLWHVILTNKKIIRLLEKCEEIPGYELFKYKDENGQINTITSQEVNGYLKHLANQPFTAKDFRTWAACRETFARLLENNYNEDENPKDTLKNTIKEVAQILGHTPSICQKNYIDPDIIFWWQKNQFKPWLQRHKNINLKDTEAVFLAWLKDKTNALS